LVVLCQVRLETALARAAQRMQRPERVSDATPQIVAEQFRSFQPLDELPSGSVLALDTEQTIDVQVAEVTRAIDERLSPHRKHSSGDYTPGEVRAFPQSNRRVNPVDDTTGRD
jgi:thymidylate kinase